MMEYDADQYKRPVGNEGRRVIEHMNDHHRDVTEWGLSNIPDMSPRSILDIVCGGGMCLSLLGKRFQNASLTGVDISEESVNAARSYNSDLVGSGRLEVLEASVSELPFKEGAFDLITAVETYFFWPDLKNDIAKVSELLSEEGVLLIVSETSIREDNREAVDAMNEKYGSKVIDDDLILSYMEAAGLNASVFKGPKKTWAAYLGTRII